MGVVEPITQQDLNIVRRFSRPSSHRPPNSMYTMLKGCGLFPHQYPLSHPYRHPILFHHLLDPYHLVSQCPLSLHRPPQPHLQQLPRVPAGSRRPYPQKDVQPAVLFYFPLKLVFLTLQSHLKYMSESNTAKSWFCSETIKFKNAHPVQQQIKSYLARIP